MTGTPVRTAPYGSWTSPITTELLTAGTVRLAETRIDGQDVYWVEGRAGEGGRAVLVRRTPDGSSLDLTPAPFNVRSRVHEYGGGAYTVRDGVVVFANFDDLRLYLLDPGAPDAGPGPLTPEGGFRYAAPEFDVRRGRLIAVREDHTDPDVEPVNTLVCLDIGGSNDDGGRVIVDGSDFVTSPTLDPDGRRLAWVTWDHPAMPWDRTTVWVADVTEDGSLGPARAITDGTYAAGQPRWAPDGRLFYISEQSGWANLTHLDVDDPGGGAASLPLLKLEFGRPGWFLGSSAYDFTADGRLLCGVVDQGVGRLVLLDPVGGGLTPVDTPAVDFDGIRVSGDAAVFTAAFPAESSAVIRLGLHGDKTVSEVLRRSTDQSLEAASISVAETVEWTNTRGQNVHGFFYLPPNAAVAVAPDELPPLLVLSHGGPTGMATSGLSLELQYWTSRGFAVLDVNYGGSTGFGRAYRDRLRGEWGVVDVEDCATGARAMADLGHVDGDRLAIRGGSAGGYTTLCALAFTDVFRAGASHFGIGDLEALVRDTHKFESRYVDGLIGPYPEAAELYRERSPINHVDHLSSPMILLQGTDDEVVPPDQAQSMADALRAKGLPVALLMFEGEGHGFRQQANITRALEAELYFYGRIFGFTPADPIEPVPIDNLP
jgi:dipeptidyl aminopeptidase/acylaminoacyl peptidase